MIGIRPHGLTCAELFDMTQGRLRLMREQVLGTAALQATENEIDVEAWLTRGSIRKYYTQHIADPELAKQVAEQLEHIKQTGRLKDG